MVTTIKKNRSNKWYCAHCMMIQRQPQEVCNFCGYLFSNIEDVWLENMILIQEDKVKNYSQSSEQYPVSRDQN